MKMEIKLKNFSFFIYLIINIIKDTFKPLSYLNDNNWYQLLIIYYLPSFVLNSYNNLVRLDDSFSIFKVTREFPGGPVVRTLCFHCWGCRFHPWSGNYDPASRGARPNTRCESCKKELRVTVVWQVAADHLDSCVWYYFLPSLHPPLWLPQVNPVCFFQLRKMLFWEKNGPLGKMLLMLLFS